VQVLGHQYPGIGIRVQDCRRDPGIGSSFKNSQFAGSVEVDATVVMRMQPQDAFLAAGSNVVYAVCEPAAEFLDIGSLRIPSGNHGECLDSVQLRVHTVTAAG
jgi:hypothetical protein